MRFEFATAGRIIFGPGTLDQVGPLAAALGQQALVVTGQTPARAAPLLDHLAKSGLRYATFLVGGEPTLGMASLATKMARESRCGLIIGFGGGSPLDTAKVVAALVANGGEPLDYAEVIGRGKPFTRRSLPFIAIPTTAGTGTEATRNAVLASPEHKVKVSLRSPDMLPRLAIVDPLLTYTMPPALTASTGLDALTQLIEPFVSTRANPVVDGLSREGMARVARSLRRAFENGQDAAAREDMSLASLLGGMALANAGLGAVHGFAGPLGGMFEAPHGAVCARLLAPTMRINVQALRARGDSLGSLQRYKEVARSLTDNPKATPEDGVAWVWELCQALGVLPLGSYGMTEADIPGLIERAVVSSSMKGNPILLTEDELQAILAEAM
jgi:alcohol dehydrogenase class IV